MRMTLIVPVFLIAIALGACSDGGGSASPGSGSPSSGGPGSGGGSSGNPPPVQTPPEPPPDDRTEPPFPSLPRPPVGTLTCNPCKKIAFVSLRDFNSEIYSVNADGSELTRLTSDPAADVAPAWSPDGRRIAFISDRDSSGAGPADPRPDLYLMDADGNNVRRLTISAGGMGLTSLAWSPDGSRIAYETWSNGSYNLWQVPAAGGTPQLLFSSPGFDGGATWSPDGTRLALESDWLGARDIFLVNSDGSGFTALTDGNIHDRVNYYHPAWSPSEDRIALTVQRDFPELDDYVNWLGVMNTDGSGLTLLLTPRLATSSGRPYPYPTEYFSDPAWSPDATTIAYTHFVYEGAFGGRYDVGWVKIDGSARGTIIGNGFDPDWQR